MQPFSLCPTMRSTVAPAAKCCAPGKVQPQQVKSVVPLRRDLLAAGGAAIAIILLGPTAAAGPAQAAGESSATRAITAVTRPLQNKKKDQNRAELKEQVEKVRQGEADPKSLP